MDVDPERDLYCMQMSTKQPRLQAAAAGSQELILRNSVQMIFIQIIKFTLFRLFQMVKITYLSSPSHSLVVS